MPALSPRLRRSLLPTAFFLSGAAGLVLEVLWFRQAGLAFGNGVWASSLVLSSFMGGLALGNAAAARWGPRIGRPLAAYAIAECAVAAAGPLLLVLLPAVSGRVSQVLAPLEADPALTNAVRFVVSFALLVVPATAMGLTLPLVVRAGSVDGTPLGGTLGSLYGWNTLGAVCGASLAELVLVPRLGVRGSALFAAGLDLVAAALGAVLAAGMPRLPKAPRLAVSPGRPAVRPILLAAAAGGALLLALEVVWFRSLAHFVVGSSLAFALMLATVLAGIAAGGFVASVLCRGERPRLDAASAFLLCGAATSLCWALFPLVLGAFDTTKQGGAIETVALGIALMFPASVLSGIAFTLVGDAVARHSEDPARATGRLTLWNTCGALVGSPVAAFLLLPHLGADGSVLIVCSLYGAAALLAFVDEAAGRAGRPARVAASSLFGICILLLSLHPPGEILLARVLARFGRAPAVKTVHVQESASETVVVLEARILEEPLYHRLVTNGFSMSGTWFRWERYMKSFVYLPVALHPAPREALLICFGVGSTARALVETPELTRIDVVDISSAVLDASRAIYRDARRNPLSDPRVHVRVEDGRYVLATTNRTWDLITAEPPPPQAAGVENLYTREYFALVRSRLRPGGVSTHWLPVHSLSRQDALAIVRAFCDTFADCSLWNGSGSDWVLLGSRDGLAPASEERIAAGFSGDGGRERARLGFERPEQLGATFLADSATLDALTRGVAPLVDDFPRRLSGRFPQTSDLRFFQEMQQALRSRRRFVESAFATNVWPAGLRGPTAAAYSGQDVVNRVLGDYLGASEQRQADLLVVLARSDLRTLPLWILGTSPEEVEIASRAWARGVRSPYVEARLAAGALARREYLAAAVRYGALARAAGPSGDWKELQAMSLALGDRGEEARAVLSSLEPATTLRLGRLLGLGNPDPSAAPR